MLRGAKIKFSTGPHKSDFEKITTSPAFEEATLAALIEMQSQLPLDCSPNQAASSHDQMAGARKYLEILCHIHQPEINPKPAKGRDLNWEAGV